jgi:isoleucyl-tRNA synthetase
MPAPAPSTRRPGHGVEDFEVGRHYGLPVFNPVDERGCFTDDYPPTKGTNVFKANPLIIEKLKESGLLLGHKPLTHSYPYSWRTRKPVIMRATEQWFLEIDKDGLRTRTLEASKKVRWIPEWGFDRIYNMLRTRPDWCLSRQRSWGVPIPSVFDRRIRKSVLVPEVMDAFIAMTAKEGTDAWYTHPIGDFLPAAMQAEAEHLEKEYNCLDVWFDSGSTHNAVLNKEYGLTWPADLYLEGSDQHRGWFQSSMWVAMGVQGAPPYRSVLTHGFVLDEHGKAMSKSLGNVVSPLDIIKQSGADVLRMWVSSEDYSGDVSIGKSALDQISNAYRRIRNTLRYCLSNLYDFDPAKDSVEHGKLGEDDRWVLHKLNELVRTVGDAYEAYEFHRVYQAVNNFCVTELGSLYLDMVKDRLYCEDTAGQLRRASQTVLYQLSATISRLMAPVLAFTADEAWEFLPGAHTVSVHLEKFPAVRAEWQDDALSAKWERLLAVRNEATKQFDRLRGNAPGAKEKVIGGSVDAKLVLRSRDAETLAFLRANRAVLETLCIVSHVSVLEEDAPALEELKAHGLAVAVEAGKADGGKCPRCRRWSVTVGQDPKHPELDARCAEVLKRSA